jgi:aspartate carbamoyltransferase catalytic subunit
MIVPRSAVEVGSMPPRMTDSNRSLLTLRGLDAATLTALLDRTESLLPVAQGIERMSKTDAGAMVGLLFLENSTRTRCSFETALHRLGHHPVSLTGQGSSVGKGESLTDTAANIAAMGVRALVVRTSYSGGADLVARVTGVPTINAGDGRHEHPTQGLLDASTLLAHLGSLRGKRILIVGDILNSRVARSNIHALATLGATVVLVGPPSLVPWVFAEFGPTIEISHDLDAVLESADAVMMLRIQLERDAGKSVSSDYRMAFGMTSSRASRLPEGVPVLHPGPINRGVELDDEVAADLARCLVLEQVSRGVAARMAILERALVLNARIK